MIPRIFALEGRNMYVYDQTSYRKSFIWLIVKFHKYFFFFFFDLLPTSLTEIVLYALTWQLDK